MSSSWLRVSFAHARAARCGAAEHWHSLAGATTADKLSSCRPLEAMEVNMEGGCVCRRVRYRLTGAPLIVHACHCRWCQRETGTAHALNALYEADRVVHLAGEPELVLTPSASGKGQTIA